MVIKFEDVVKPIKQKDCVKELERIIDNSLRKFTGKDIYINVGYPERKVVTEIKRIYQEAGWNVRYQRGNPREPEAYLIFTPGGKK